jgi:hypothetical protein
MRKSAHVARKGKALSWAAYLLKPRWAVAVLIIRSSMPVLYTVCPIVSRRNRKKLRR